MSSLITKSFFGGSEIIQINNPTLFLEINSLDFINSHTKLKTSIENIIDNHFTNKKFINFIEKDSFSHLVLPHPNMKFISAFLADNIALYYPKTEKDNFWFDLLSLEYFHSIDFFKTCITFITNKYSQLIHLNLEQLSSLLKSPLISFPKFPMCIYFEEIE
jgi:hypothetical protein